MDNLFFNPIFWGSVVFAYIFYVSWRKKKMKPLINEYLDKKAVIVDVRSPEEFKSGHCQGSINIPLNVLEARMHELDKSKHFILCCASGGRSSMAQTLLKSKGFEQVINAGPWSNVVRS